MKMLCALALLVTGCASHAQGIQDEVLRRVDVDHPNWYAKDYRVIPEGQRSYGNCSTFAATAVSLVPGAMIMPCPKLKHVFAFKGGTAWDARYKTPVGLSEAIAGCF